MQGPESRGVLADVFGAVLPDVGYFRFKEIDTPFGTVLLSRTGYTGERGYEIYLPMDKAGDLWDRLIEHVITSYSIHYTKLYEM